MTTEELYGKARAAGIGHIFEFGEYPSAGENFYFLDLMINLNHVEAREQIRHNVRALRKLTDEIEVVGDRRIVFRVKDNE